MMNRLCSERVWHCGGDCTHGFTFA
jgi:hypothetical protein